MSTGRIQFLKNTLMALLFGIVAAVIIPPSGNLPAVLFAFGYALFFEYAFHRWCQHAPNNLFAVKHHTHHATYRKREELEHVNFGGNPLLVAALFTVNSAILALIDAVFGLNWLPAGLLTFVIYFIVMEWIHFRVHALFWTPFGLGYAHHEHHKRPSVNFNIFIPLFDYIFGTVRRVN
jgi:hypothetical protein